MLAQSLGIPTVLEDAWGEAGRDPHDDNSGKIGSFVSFEWRHGGAARARDGTAAQCVEQTKARRSPEKLAEEQDND